jgi:NTE family protein
MNDTTEAVCTDNAYAQSTATATKKISLALQGGGAHGAFTWGVLEKILEDPRIDIEALCGTSAGAMNAVIVAYGLQTGGRQGAIDLLEKFWKKVSSQQQFSLLQPSLIDKKISNGRLDYSPAYQMFDFYSMLFSPYQFNPMDYNPLRKTLSDFVNFEELRKNESIKLFVCATNVRTSRAKVFEMSEMSVDAVLASACLPFLFKAVEIDGESYWDGGYMGNPPIFPLIDGAESADILLIQINPIKIDKVPQTAEEIRDRVNTLSFNSSLMHEMRRVNFVQKMLSDGYNMHGVLRNLRIHNINPEIALGSLGVSSKMNAEWSFLQKLRKLGHAMAADWIRKNFDQIGVSSTCDVKEIFL